MLHMTILINLVICHVIMFNLIFNFTCSTVLQQRVDCQKILVRNSWDGATVL